MSLTDTLTLVAALAAIAAAYFGYPVWRESRRRADLRLSIHASSHSGVVDTEIVDNSGQNQVVFGLVLSNEGNREARFWRLAIIGPEQPPARADLGSGDRAGRTFRDPRFIDGRWITEALT